MAIITRDGLEIIKTICSVTSAFGVLLAACGLWFQIQVWTDYHERARSDRAISLLSELAKSLSPANRAVQKLEANLGDVKLRKLRGGEPFSIDVADLHLLDAALGEKKRSPNKHQQYDLTPQESFALRWQIASYLNAVEIVCQAAMSDVANTKIIERQLSGLFDREKGFTFCEHYRGVVDGKDHVAYPAIHHFVTKVLGDKTQDNQIGGGY